MGLTGKSDEGISIEVFDCPSDGTGQRNNRRSAPEALKALELLGSADDSTSIAILTPYKNQVKLIRDKLRSANLEENVDVLNTHKAQGREWDWVIFSVVDDGRKNGPWFTDSTNSQGCAVLNTTISRAKSRLTLLLHKDFWNRRDCLIGELTKTFSK